MAIGLVLALYLILSYVVLSNVPATSLESHTETAVAQAAYPVLGMWGFSGRIRSGSHCHGISH